MCILDSRQIPYIVYISRDLLYIVYTLLETFQKISLGGGQAEVASNFSWSD